MRAKTTLLALLKLSSPLAKSFKHSPSPPSPTQCLLLLVLVFVHWRHRPRLVRQLHSSYRLRPPPPPSARPPRRVGLTQVVAGATRSTSSEKACVNSQGLFASLTSRVAGLLRPSSASSTSWMAELSSATSLKHSSGLGSLSESQSKSIFHSKPMHESS